MMEHEDTTSGWWYIAFGFLAGFAAGLLAAELPTAEEAALEAREGPSMGRRLIQRIPTRYSTWRTFVKPRGGSAKHWRICGARKASGARRSSGRDCPIEAGRGVICTTDQGEHLAVSGVERDERLLQFRTFGPGL